MSWPDAPSPWECRCGAVWALAEDEEDEALAQPPPGGLQSSSAEDEEGEEDEAPASLPSSAPAPSSLIDVLCRKVTPASIRRMVTDAYAEDPIGIAAKAKAQLQAGARAPPPLSDPTVAKRRRKSKAERMATKLMVAACSFDVAPTGGGGGLGTSQPRNGGHPKSQGGSTSLRAKASRYASPTPRTAPTRAWGRVGTIAPTSARSASVLIATRSATATGRTRTGLFTRAKAEGAEGASR